MKGFSVLILCFIAFQSMPGAVAGQPNIVFILADDINRDTWGIYGSRDCKTPNIDRLARDGMRFDRAYSAVAMCAPFRQELYSGCSPWRTGTLELGTHVLLVQFLDAVPVEVQLLRDVLDGFLRAAPPHVVGEAPRVERAVGQEAEPLGLHRLAAAAIHPPQFELEIDAVGTAGQIAHPPRPAVVPPGVNSPAAATGRFFERRTSLTTRACGSPKIPRTGSWGRKPGNRYASSRRFRRVEVGIGKSCQIWRPPQMRETQYRTGSQHDSRANLTHTFS